MIFLEVRDRATFIPVVAIKIEPSSPQAMSLYRKAGHALHPPLIQVLRLDNNRGTIDLYEWGDDRTMSTAHQYIEINYDDLKDGDVIDIEYILEETTTKKEPQ